MPYIKGYKGPAAFEQDTIDAIRRYGKVEGGYTEADIVEGKRSKPAGRLSEEDFAFPEDIHEGKRKKKKKKKGSYAYVGPADGLLPDAYPLGSVDLSESDEFYRRKRERQRKK